MKPNRTIQLKAIFLIIVFSLNTLIGFACAVGMNMGFNKKHHHHEKASRLTVSHYHEKGAAHHHHHHHEALTKKKAAKHDDCCSNKASQLSASDKLLAQTINSGIEMPVALVFLHFLYSSDLSSLPQDITKIPVVRPFVLNSRGIRVSIQSFQI